MRLINALEHIWSFYSFMRDIFTDDVEPGEVYVYSVALSLCHTQI